MPVGKVAVTQAIGLASLTGCGASQPVSGSVEDVRAEAKKLGRPLPGQYRQTTYTTVREIAGMQLQDLSDMLGKGRESEFCYTEAMAERGFRAMYRYRDMIEGTDCSFDRYDASGGKLDAANTCLGEPGDDAEAEPGTKVQFSITGNVGTEVSVMRAMTEVYSTALSRPMLRSGELVVSERTGDCPAG